ncbi:MAG: DUF177 domain-containing protein [Bacteroidales bacterium]|nr:DUF177 domain-containing protein [Bacteroidales bacterium]
MDFLDQYVISLKGLKDGEYKYTFEVLDKFFEHFEKSEINKANIIVEVIINKVLSVMTLIINISGEVEVECDRCLDKLMLPISISNTLYIKTETENKIDDDDIIYISDFEQQINVAQYIYEFVELNMPIKKTHPIDKYGKSMCNKEMLNKINELESKKTDDIDPRWENLKKFREK